KTLGQGARVCSIPILVRPGDVQSVGYSHLAPGGYGEQMLLSEALLLPVPDGLPTEMAALTEPMAVGLHAVEMARLQKGEIPLVIGCGPVGLAVVSALKMKGIGPVIAADFSSARRKAAENLGADKVINPAQISPYQSWLEMASREINGEPVPLEPISGRLQYRNGVFFECVGVPGVIDEMMRGAQRGCRIVVVGVCMQEDHIQPLRGITRELNIQFVLGYTPEEFAATLQHIADGKLRVDGLITSRTGVNGVPEAFERLASPEEEIKILVEPWR
ncbi:MAG: zinc-binding dehydrogenase, partial [Gammaproteobacteria bacterium]|nr:zinc-binding dehydrogenase [Gammaproteobacteria bacterium]